MTLEIAYSDRRTNIKPILIIGQTYLELLNRTNQIIGGLLEGRLFDKELAEPLLPKDICVLNLSNNAASEKDFDIVKGFKNMISLLDLKNVYDKDVDTVLIEEKYPAFFSTVHSAKGFQFKAVIVFAADVFGEKWKDKEDKETSGDNDYLEENRRLFYVAITRAENILIIMGRGKNQFIEELESFVAERILEYRA